MSDMEHSEKAMKYPYPDVQWSNLEPCVRQLHTANTGTRVTIEIEGYGRIDTVAWKDADWHLLLQFMRNGIKQAYPWRVSTDTASTGMDQSGVGDE